MPSIYRPKHSVIAPEAEVCDQTSWVGRRKAQPVDVLLPATRRWLDSLPKETRPRANDCSAFISSLLLDQRGGRGGFPGDVLHDIHNLRVYYTRLHPIVDWDR